MPPRPTPAHPAPIPLWPLALLAALLPTCAALGAAWWSMRAGLVPSCNPFFEGCVSISRAARHDLANHGFRALMLPAATLQGLVWIVAARWLRAMPIERARGERWIAPLGVMAALALVLYATFLGTEGSIYRALRHYGTAAYFGFTCICLLLAGGAIRRASAAGVLPLAPALARSVLVLGAALVTLGIVNTLVAATLADPWKDRVENASEWWGAAIFVLAFAALALMWRRIGLVLELGAVVVEAARSPTPPPSPHRPAPDAAATADNRLHSVNPQPLSDYAQRALALVPGLVDMRRMATLLLAERTPPRGHVLVVGAGGGLELEAFTQAHGDWRLVGVDPSTDMLDLAKVTLGPLASRVQFHQGFVDTAPLGPFDAASCLLTLHFTATADERCNTLRQIHRRLKPGAPFVVMHLSFGQSGAERSLWLSRYAAFAIASGVDVEKARAGAAAIDDRLTILAPEQDEALMRDAGFSDVNVFYAGLAFRGWIAHA